MMPLYRNASNEDADKIAQLHSASWQLHYRGILDDFFLDHQVQADRKKVWRARLQKFNPNRCLILAEELGHIIGFGCVFLRDNKDYGALLDNLHVARDYSGKGIGKELMCLLAKEIIQKDKRHDMYLWVLKDNISAIRFYEKLKGQRKEEVMEKEVGNEPVTKIRYYWPNVAVIIENGVISK